MKCGSNHFVRINTTQRTVERGDCCNVYVKIRGSEVAKNYQIGMNYCLYMDVCWLYDICISHPVVFSQ